MTEQEKEAKKTEEAAPAPPKDVLVETKHSLTIDGQGAALHRHLWDDGLERGGRKEG